MAREVKRIKMHLSTRTGRKIRSSISVAFAFALGSLLLLPVAIATSSGSDYQIEVLRAQGIVPSPSFSNSSPLSQPVGLVHSVGPDVSLGIKSSEFIGTAQQVSLLKTAGYLP